MLSVIQGCMKTKELVGYVKVNWKPPRHRRRSGYPKSNPHVIC